MKSNEPGTDEPMEEPLEEREEKHRFKDLKSEVLEDGDEILITGDDELLRAFGALVYKEIGGSEWSVEDAEAQLRLGVTLRPRSMWGQLDHNGLHVNTWNFRGSEERRKSIADAVDFVLGM